jgi:diacyltrehalose acyltransferase
MKKLLGGAMAVAILSSAGALGNGLAAAETAYNVGGAKVPGFPWYEFTYRAGSGYLPDASRVVVDYPAGAIQGRLLQDVLPGSDLVTPSVGESVVTGMDNLDAAIRTTTNGPAAAVGLSEGALVLDAEQARLAHDPAAPPPDQLSFNVFGDPARSHAFGQSMLTTLFPPGTFVPVVDYTVPKPVESQYHTTMVVAAYDGVADFPDRPSNLLSVLNAVMGAAFGHTPVAFTGPDGVPPQNIRTITNSKGATTTTYLVPDKYLPLTLPLHYLGVSPETVNEIDRALQPMVDAGYSRNDNPRSAPTAVDPVAGLDPLDALDPATRANMDGLLAQARGLLPIGIS